MRTLLIPNEAPYGNERTYNGLRLAGSLVKRSDESVRVFLLGDAAVAAKSGQTTPMGYYNIGRMIQVVRNHHGVVGICGTCMDARGMTDPELLSGARRSSLEELTDWVLWADRVLVF